MIVLKIKIKLGLKISKYKKDEIQQCMRHDDIVIFYKEKYRYYLRGKSS